MKKLIITTVSLGMIFGCSALKPRSYYSVQQAHQAEQTETDSRLDRLNHGVAIDKMMDVIESQIGQKGKCNGK